MRKLFYTISIVLLSIFSYGQGWRGNLFTVPSWNTQFTVQLPEQTLVLCVDSAKLYRLLINGLSTSSLSTTNNNLLFGAIGTTGLTGSTGLQGITGPTGINGINGVTGPTGITGSNGVTTHAGYITAYRPGMVDTSFTQLDTVSSLSARFPAGTFFYVSAGTYYVKNNLWLDTKMLYFDNSVVINNSTANNIIYVNGAPTTPVYIGGSGTFKKLAGSSGSVFRAYIPSNPSGFICTFDFNNIYSTVGIGIETYLSHFWFNGSSVFSTASYAIDCEVGGAQTTFNINSIASTGNTAAYIYRTQTNIICNSIESSVNYGLDISTAGGSLGCTVNAFYINGAGTKGISLTNYGQANISALYCSGITIANYCAIQYTGKCAYLNMAGNGSCVGGVFQTVVISDGFADIWREGIIQGSSVTVTGGHLKIRTNYDAAFTNTPFQFNLSGGITDVFSDRDLAYYDVSGSATLNFYGYAIMSGSTKSYIINQSGGTVNLYGNLKEIADGNFYENLIVKSGGTLNLSGCTFQRDDSTSVFISATTAQNICVKTSYDNGTTGDLLSAKKRKDSLIVVAATQPTTIVIAGNTFTSTLTASKTVIATDLVTQINTAAIGVTAYDLLNGRFAIMANVAGTNYTLSGAVNLTVKNIRQNSYAKTDVCGGSILENSNITF